MSLKNKRPEVDGRFFYDLEVSQAVVGGYGTRWDFKPVKLIRGQELMCYAYAWGDAEPIFVSRHDYKNQKELVKSLRDLICLSQMTVAYNGDKFDNKMANTFFIKEKLDLPSPSFSVDPIKTFRGKMKLFSNSLQDVSEFLGMEGKKKITYANIEDDYMSDKPKRLTLQQMKEYNIQDIIAMRNAYYRVLPLISNHPNMLRLNDMIEGCPQCGGDRIHRRGYQYTKVNAYKRYKCLNPKCKKWFRAAKPEEFSPKPQYTNIAGN
jgi:hypothetical protein